MHKGKSTPPSCNCVIVAYIRSRKLDTFMDRGNCDQGMLDCWLRMAGLKEQAFPEVRILLAKYYSYTLEAKEVVATSFLVVTRDINAKLYDSGRDIAIASSAAARTSQACRLLFVAF